MVSGAGATARQARQFAKSLGARLSGKERGRDRSVLRNSFDVDDARAKPWAPIGKGTVGEGLAHREALLQAAEEHRLQHWRENPRVRIREARLRRDDVAAELARIDAGIAAPPGRAAELRMEKSKLEQLLDAARDALRRIDVTILGALIKRVEFRTGKLFPAIDTIAADAGCHRNSVVGALQRLRKHGFIAWVRRSIATGNQGEFAPQREQTSNAYYFDHRRQMAKRTWQRFVQLLTTKLRRLGKVRPELPSQVPSVPPADPHGVYAALAALGASIANAST